MINATFQACLAFLPAHGDHACCSKAWDVFIGIAILDSDLIHAGDQFYGIGLDSLHGAAFFTDFSYAWLHKSPVGRCGELVFMGGFLPFTNSDIEQGSSNIPVTGYWLQRRCKYECHHNCCSNRYYFFHSWLLNLFFNFIYKLFAASWNHIA